METLIGIVVILVVVGVIVLSRRFSLQALVLRKGTKIMEQPSQLPLEADEQRVAEMYAGSRDVTLSGFTVVGSALEGKMILTTKRLVYCRYDEKGIALTIRPSDIQNIDTDQYKDVLSTTYYLMITFTAPGSKKPRSVRWNVPGEAVINEFPLGMKRFKNPQTAENFATLLRQWKAGDVNKPLPPTLPRSLTEPIDLPRLDTKKAAELRGVFRAKTTEELNEMWRKFDTKEWQPEALEAVRQVLVERGQGKTP